MKSSLQKLFPILPGILIAGLLLLLLALLRLQSSERPEKPLTVREVEIALLPPPPPPPPDEPPPLEVPPPPALTELDPVRDLSRVALPVASLPQQVRLSVDPFSPDLAPPPLPVVEAPAPVKRPTPTPQVSRPEVTSRPAPPKPRPVAPPRTTFTANELDGLPRVIRMGRASFPTALSRRGITQGNVMLEVELSTAGRVSVRRVISAQYPELVEPAKQIAVGTRYTTPKKGGQPAKAILRLPIILKK